MRGYAAQVSPKIDAARAKKNPFRMETIYGLLSSCVSEEIQQITTFTETANSQWSAESEAGI